jgi:MFS family permease
MKNWFLFTMAGLSGLLYGIDIGVIAAALPYLKASTSFTDAQLSLIVGAVVMGAVISALFAGALAERFGRRMVIALSAAAFTLSVPIICLSAGSFLVMMFGRLLQGASQGLISVVMPMYLAETLPAEVRGKGTGFFHFMLSIGLVAVAVLGFVIASLTGDAAAAETIVPVAAKTRAWQMNFWISGVPGILLFFGALRLKESPYWLANRGKKGETRRNESAAVARDSVWQRKYMVPFALVFVILVCTQATGINALMNYSVSILSDIGLPGALANAADTVIKIVNLVMTLFALALVDRRGRRFLLKTGTLGVIAAHLAAGIIFLAVRMGWVEVSLWTGVPMMAAFILLVAFYAIGPGVCVWLVLSELMPGRIRANGMSIALFFNRGVAMAITSSFLPWAGAWGYDGICFTLAACTVVYFIAVAFFMPETKGKTLEEIEQFFVRSDKK